MSDSTVHSQESVDENSQQPLRNADKALRRAVAAAQTAEDNRGRDIVILDVREMTTIFDYFVLATGTSRRQLHAMSEEIDHTLEDDMNDHRMGIEGYRESRWIVLDYGDVVIHLFEPDTRRYYALEQLWDRAKPVPFPSRAAPDAESDAPEPHPR